MRPRHTGSRDRDLGELPEPAGHPVRWGGARSRVPEASWWMGKSRAELNAEARKRWPTATSGEKVSNVTLACAVRNGVL